MANLAFSHLTHDFRFARLEALREAVDDLLRQRPRLLLTGTDARARLCIRRRTDLGLQSVPIYKIVSRTGRYTEFDRWLSPSDHSFTDHEPVAGSIQAPIELYKAGEVYFVKDGNYRVAQARARGQLFLPAHVVEYVIDRAVDGLIDPRDILLSEERHSFLETTGLAQLRPTEHVVCAVLGNYAQIMQHVETHCYDLRAEWGRPIKWNVAAASWYDTIYMPIVSLIYRQRILEHFPDYHEADLYLWAIEHRRNAHCSSSEDHTSRCNFRDRLKDGLSNIIALGRALHTDATVGVTDL